LPCNTSYKTAISSYIPPRPSTFYFYHPPRPSPPSLTRSVHIRIPYRVLASTQLPWVPPSPGAPRGIQGSQQAFQISDRRSSTASPTGYRRRRGGEPGAAVTVRSDTAHQLRIRRTTDRGCPNHSRLTSLRRKSPSSSRHTPHQTQDTSRWSSHPNAFDFCARAPSQISSCLPPHSASHSNTTHAETGLSAFRDALMASWSADTHVRGQPKRGRCIHGGSNPGPSYTTTPSRARAKQRHGQAGRRQA
jgi:hypothetical protein